MLSLLLCSSILVSSTQPTPVSSLCLFFFFKQKTAYEMRISDWSSDVCSSDLQVAFQLSDAVFGRDRSPEFKDMAVDEAAGILAMRGQPRSEERRVGERVCQYV